MRTAVAVLATIACFILTAITGPLFWVDRNIVDRDGFVQTIRPLGSDEAFQKSLAQSVSRRVAANTDLPPAVQALVGRVVDASAQKLVTLEGYPQAWEESLARSHDLTIGEQAEESSAAFSLDVAPLAALVAEEVTRVAKIEIPAPETAVIQVGSLKQRQIIEPSLKMASLWVPLAIGAALAFALAVISSRRRGLLLLVMGVLAAVVATFWKVGAAIGIAVLGGSVDEGLEKLVIDRFGDVVAAHVDTGFWIFMAAGGALIVAGIIIQAVDRRKEFNDGGVPA